jgi:hypothetical protein
MRNSPIINTFGKFTRTLTKVLWCVCPAVALLTVQEAGAIGRTINYMDDSVIDYTVDWSVTGNSGSTDLTNFIFNLDGRLPSNTWRFFGGSGGFGDPLSTLWQDISYQFEPGGDFIGIGSVQIPISLDEFHNLLGVGQVSVLSGICVSPGVTEFISSSISVDQRPTSVRIRVAVPETMPFWCTAATMIALVAVSRFKSIS